jgi:hypothetical protein
MQLQRKMRQQQPKLALVQEVQLLVSQLQAQEPL